MRVDNHAPVSPEALELVGTGATELVVETDFHKVQRVDEVVQWTEQVLVPERVREYDSLLGEYVTRIELETREIEHTDIRGPIICEPQHSPCRVMLSRGEQTLWVKGDLFNSPAVHVGVTDRALTMRVRRERNAWAEGCGLTAMAFGVLGIVFGTVQATTGKARPEHVSPDDMRRHGSLVAAGGLGLTLGGYWLTTFHEPGEVSIERR